MAQRAYQQALDRVRRLEDEYQVKTSEAQKSGFRQRLAALGARLPGFKKGEGVPKAELQPVSPAALAEDELSYTAQARQLAQRLLAYQERADHLAEFEKNPGAKVAQLPAAAPQAPSRW